MRYPVAALSFLASCGVALAQESAAQPSGVRATIDRGLAFLVKDALAWKSEHNCASCHHAGLVIWSMHEAKQRGLPSSVQFGHLNTFRDLAEVVARGSVH